LRTSAFMLASATWITTLIINLNPFMRFDGYFLISDFWGVDNLQNRAFALCRWRLREALFGYGEPAPEPWPAAMQRRLLVWGYGSWLWRAVLFFGIALAVYHLFFKVLGIFLMLVELLWFIGLPIWREMKEWWQRRDQADPRKVMFTGIALGVILLALVVPWRGSVDVPALLEAARVSALHAPVAARLKAVHVQDGQAVEAGDLLLELDAPDLDSRQAIVRREIQILQLQLRRQSARSETAADAGILEQRLAEAVAEYRGLAAQRERLQLRAPQAGVVRDLQPDLTAGRWLNPAETLARVVEPGLRLRGYLAEESLWRVKVGSEGRFIADDPARPAMAVRLDEVDATGVAYLELEALGSDHQGPIAVRRDEQRRAEPVQAQYGVRLSLLEPGIRTAQPLRGVVVLDGEGQSWLGAAWRRLAALGVRESGF
jgi:putative peptide zinc metalloprotease protein